MMSTHPGRLIYIVGPSGAGKDTLLRFAAEALDGSPVLFAHRYITRPPGDGTEAHIPLSARAFRARRELGLFALDWRSHGLDYGIGIEIDQWRAQGAAVVVNGSRADFAHASARYPDLLPVLITASRETLRRRLLVRAREGAAEIEARLTREVLFDPPGLVTIANDGDVAESGRALAHLLAAQV